MSRSGESGTPQVRPIVYHPYAEPDPSSYEQYADPAAAHGWENAYDETQRLPPVPGVEEAGGRADRRRAVRRTGGWRSRRVVVAAGAVGAVSLAAVVAGLSLSGPATDGRQGEQGGPADTRSSSDDTASPSASPSPSAGGSTGSAGPSPSASTAAAAAPSPGDATSSAPADASSAGDPTASDPASPTAQGSGKGNGKGRGTGKGGR
ncbi:MULTISPECIES: hypothetical protein [unclassified Streptomyces]|uniref:hypothetical protein n=1 Tax=unclassified Streptomyces TaxID=2593676 RepID=UPI003322B316